MQSRDGERLAKLTAKIISAYVSNNSVASKDLASLISTIHSALLSAPGLAVAPGAEGQQPAVPIRTSVRPDYIVCLEDGQKFKSLRRHLRFKHGISPEEYREKWHLKPDYPMVAPRYAQTRSELAKALGFGRKRTTPSA
jgi:predicted transcriptional regulator